MKKKLIGFLIIMLLITVSLPVVSSNIINRPIFNYIQNDDFIPGEFIVKLDEGMISDGNERTLNKMEVMQKPELHT